MTKLDKAWDRYYRADMEVSMLTVKSKHFMLKANRLKELVFEDGMTVVFRVLDSKANASICFDGKYIHGNNMDMVNPKYTCNGDMDVASILSGAEDIIRENAIEYGQIIKDRKKVNAIRKSAKKELDKAKKELASFGYVNFWSNGRGFKQEVVACKRSKNG